MWLAKVTHYLELYLIALPPALPLFIKKAFVVYPVMEHAEVMLVGRQWED